MPIIRRTSRGELNAAQAEAPREPKSSADALPELELRPDESSGAHRLPTAPAIRRRVSVSIRPIRGAGSLVPRAPSLAVPPMRGGPARTMTVPMMAAARVPQISTVREASPPSTSAVRAAPPPPPPPPPPASSPRPASPASGPRTEPRRHGTVKMQAVAPPESPPSSRAGAPSSGRLFDDLDFQSEAQVELELDGVPHGHTTYDTLAGPRSGGPVVRFTPQPMRAVGEPTLPIPDEPPCEPTLVLARAPVSKPTPARETQPGGPVSGVQRPPTPVIPVTPAVDPKRPGVFAFAGFGIAPESWGAAPTYAFRVLSRRRVLRRDLALARARRSPDVELYEAALRTADESVVRRGLLLVAMVFLAALGAFVGAIELLF